MSSADDGVPGTAEKALALDSCRGLIDNLDRQLLELLRLRMEVARQIGGIKRALGLPVLDDGREVELLARLSAAAAAPLTPEMIGAIWPPILAASRSLQQWHE